MGAVSKIFFTVTFNSLSIGYLCILNTQRLKTEGVFKVRLRKMQQGFYPIATHSVQYSSSFMPKIYSHKKIHKTPFKNIIPMHSTLIVNSGFITHKVHQSTSKRLKKIDIPKIVKCVQSNIFEK